MTPHPNESQTPRASMDLATFVSETLQQIVQGVVLAQEACGALEAIINPGQVRAMSTPGLTWHDGSGVLVKPVEFDVAVTEIAGEGKKGGFGVFLGSVGFGRQATSDSSTSALSRVKFTVPIALPSGEGAVVKSRLSRMRARPAP